MISAEEIVAALDAQVSNLEVADRLGCGEGRVRRVRATAGILPYRRGRRAQYGTWAEVYEAHTIAVEGGHLEWTGPVSEYGTPLMRLRAETTTVYRYAFRLQHGRDAEGKTLPECGYEHCVAGAHLEDRVMREHREDLGLLSPPPQATWYRDVDLVAVRRVMQGIRPRPALTDREVRYAVVAMTRAGISAEDIAQRLGLLKRTVVRYRSDAGLTDDDQ